MAQLGDLADITSGFAFKSAYFNATGNGLPLIRIRDVVGGCSDTYYSGNYSPEYLVKNGDALIGMDGQFNLARWRGGVALLNQRVCRLKAVGDNVDRAYLLHFLPAALKKIEDRTPFVTVKHLSVKTLREIEVPLPPISEQRRIAAILDKTTDLGAKRRESLIKLDRLIESVFLKMFGDPVTNPKGWPTVEFASAVEFLTGYPFKSPEFVPAGHGIKLCRGTNVLPSELDWSDEANWPISDINKFDRFKILAGDVVIAMDRPWISSGFKIVLVDQSDPACLLVQRVARLRPLSHFGPNFIYALFASESFKRHCKPTETTIPHISPNDFRSFPILNPGASSIAAFEAVANKIKIQRQSLLGWDLSAERLFVSLQQRAFEGNL